MDSNVRVFESELRLSELEVPIDLLGLVDDELCISSKRCGYHRYTSSEMDWLNCQ